MSSRQLQEWRQYANLEPFGEERADARSAQVAQAVYNVHRRKRDNPVKLQDCMLPIGEKVAPAPARRGTWQRMKDKALSIAGVANGR